MIAAPFAWLLLLSSIFLASVSLADPVADLYDDPRIAQWSREYLAGNSDQVLRAVEADLLSAAPHPFAAQVWVNIHERRDRLERAWSRADGELRAALGPLAEIALLEERRRYGEIAERWPAERAAEIDDPWALAKLAFAAAERDRLDEKLEYLLAGIRRYPAHFQFFWMLSSDSLLANDSRRERLREFLQAWEGAGESLVHELLSARLETHRWSGYDDLQAAETWLEIHPDDARASVAKYYALVGLNRWEESTPAIVRATENFPFYSNRHEVAKALIREERFDAARQALVRYDRALFADPEPRSARDYAMALRETQERGLAREVLKQALETWPDEPRLLRELALLELADGRSGEALQAAERAVKAEPGDLKYRLTWIEAQQKAGRLKEAWETFATLREKTAHPNRDFWILGGRLLAELGRKQERVAWMESGFERFPGAWVGGQLAEALWDADRQQEAYDLLGRVLRAQPSYTWAVNRLAEYATSLMSGLDAPWQAIEGWARRYPWQQGLWDALVQRAGWHATAEEGTEQRRRALWRQAAQANPGALWPWERLVDRLVEDQEWDLARTVAEEAFGVLENGDREAHIERWALRAYVAKRASSRTRVAADEVGRALADIQAYRDAGGNLKIVHDYSYWLLRSRGQPARDQTLETALAWVRYDTSQYDVLGRDPLNDGAKALYWGYRHVRRAPFDGERLRQLAHYHIQWWGSPIVGLQLIERIKRDGLLSESRYYDLEASAYDRLGDARKNFENYRGRLSPGSSERYLSWFERTRRKVLEPKRRKVTVLFDREPVEAEILLANGEVLRRVDHPISGKIQSLSKGPAYALAEYDENGLNVRRIAASSGQEVRFRYDVRGRIVAVDSPEGGAVKVQYDGAGNITGIEKPGVGRVDVRYDDAGEIESTSATLPDGSPGGFTVSRAIFSSMAQMSELEGLFKQADARLPSLPFTDVALEDLRQASAELRWGNPAEFAAAQLALARYLVEHLGDSADYADELRALLQEIQEAPAESLSQRLARAESIHLWHSLTRSTKPKGIPGEELEQWGSLREWLRQQAGKGDDPRFVRWFEDVDREPLALLPEAYWLPTSDLVNSGFWRRFGRDELLPKTVHQAPLRSSLVRANGDVVVGSTAGLSVLRKGFWEWFGFDDELGRFSRDVSASLQDVGAEVLALAETGDGTLWVGTANGLLRLSGDYDGEPQHWHGQTDGLPAARVERLASDANRVWIGTPAGLASMAPEDARPVPADEWSGGVRDLLVSRRAAELSVEEIVDIASGDYFSLLLESEFSALDGLREQALSAARAGSRAMDILSGPAVTVDALLELRRRGSQGLSKHASQSICLGSEAVFSWLEERGALFSRAEREGIEGYVMAVHDDQGSVSAAEAASRLLALLGDPPPSAAQVRARREAFTTDLRSFAEVYCEDAGSTMDDLQRFAMETPLTLAEIESIIALFEAYEEDEIDARQLVLGLVEVMTLDLAGAEEIVTTRRAGAGDLRALAGRITEDDREQVEGRIQSLLGTLDKTAWDAMPEDVDEKGAAELALAFAALLDPAGLDARTLDEARRQSVAGLTERLDSMAPAEACAETDELMERVERARASLWLSLDEEYAFDMAEYTVENGPDLARSLLTTLGESTDAWLAEFEQARQRREAMMAPLQAYAEPGDCLSPDQLYVLVEDLPMLAYESDTLADVVEAAGPVSDLIDLLAPQRDVAVAILEAREERAGRIRAGLGATLTFVSGDDGLVSFEDGKRTLLTDRPVDAMAWDESRELLYYLRDDQVYGLSPAVDGDRPTVAELVPDQHNIRYAKRIYGLRMVDVGGPGQALAVLTDSGLSLYRDWHFEHLPLPLEQQRGGLSVGPEMLAQGGGNLYLASHEGVYGFEPGNALRFDRGRVYDLAVDDVLGLTFVALKDSLAYIDHRNPGAGLQDFSGIRATHLRLGQDGSLIANDALEVVRFERGSTTPQVLFSARQGVSEKGWTGPLRSILVAGDGSIWAASGSSVFRWRDGAAEEFNYLLDPQRAPFQSEMISRVIETVDGQIWVIASDESHLNHNGVMLEGGLFRWSGDGFAKVEPKGSAPWFLTGYTPISEDTAIAGGVRGFVRHRTSAEDADCCLEAYASLDDSSYLGLSKQHPMLWLGRQGARLDEDSWLFPCAGGLVLYHKGTWHYPNRLNQMLPDDQAVGQWGGRTVHAVGVNQAGTIFAGTDRGLLVYTGAGDIAALLANNDMSEVAFTDQAVNRERELREVFLGALDEHSEGGRLLARLNGLEEEIETLRNPPSALQADGRAGPGGVDDSRRAAPRLSSEERAEALRKRLQSRERARNRILAQLEHEHYGLFQMLHLDPRELAAMHKELQPGQAVVQYIPTPKKLLIQVASRDQVLLREVEVPEEALAFLALNVAEQLRLTARELSAAVPDRAVLQLGGGGGESRSAGPPALADLSRPLAQLYELLLRPVERELAGVEHVFIVPVGPLTYVPFAALLRSAGEHPEYAAQRFNLGVLNSLYHLDLVLKHRPSYVDQALLVGDPDGSLPGAREEVRTLAAELVSAMEPVIGEQATLDALIERLPDARIAHLATHGVLDSEHPDRSYLLLADGYRLDVVDISTMDLADTDLAVLSACESGIGKQGLEYATLARAFAHANVPSIVASLWAVNDEATRRLMVDFHRRYEKEADVLRALSGAQRMMLSQEAPFNHPAAWAAFEAFGRP